MSSWDFNCPQFVDFEAGLHGNSPNDAWFESLNLKSRRDPLDKHGFGPRMATPKFKPTKDAKNSPYVNTNRPVKTDDEKLKDLRLPMRRSRSACSLDKDVEGLKTPEKVSLKTQSKGQRKRSLSENCIGTKKKVYPTTPKCLKRTLHHLKSKRAKTTEELELEKITELQNKLLQHLKLNEVNLKRIKMNKPPVMIQNFQMKYKCDKNNKGGENKDMNVPFQKFARSKSFNRKTRNGEENYFGASKITHAQSLKIKLDKLSCVLNSKNVKPSMPSNVLRDVNSNREEKKVPQKKIPFGLYNAHTGLKFLPNQSTTVPHPFSFDSSYASSQSASFRIKDTKKVSSISVNQSCIINKENMRLR